jgi:hypothetical protein
LGELYKKNVLLHEECSSHMRLNLTMTALHVVTQRNLKQQKLLQVMVSFMCHPRLPPFSVISAKLCLGQYDFLKPSFVPAHVPYTFNT